MDFTIVDALLTSVIGILTVMAILAIIAVLIILVSKIIRKLESSVAKSEAVIGSEPAATASAGVPMPEGMNEGEVELVGTDEKTAAVIMALVSHNSGIPLNRLSFKSIKLLDEKGADTNGNG
ncbi:MAG: OadG family protein [Clostridia bacterium]|nr:OadG family protein [Clostridia bacterium]